MDSTTDIALLIKSIPLFHDLTPQQVEKFVSLSSMVEIYPGESPMHEGDRLDDLYVLLEGEVKVELHVPTFGQIETSRLGAFDILGWSAMTPVVRQRTGTITAVTHCWLLRLNKVLLSALCEEDHDVGFLLYRRLANVVATSFLTTRLELMNQLLHAENSV